MPAGYLLDTNVVSETRKRRADPAVLAFLFKIREAESRIFISVLTLGELRKGVAARRAANVQEAERLAQWVDEIEADFSERVMAIDTAVARIWGELSAGRSLPVIDTLIAATALVHDLILVTRNVRDMTITGVAMVNPWGSG